MNFQQDIADRVSKLATQSLVIATSQEAGMSETPLSTLFGDIRSGKLLPPVEIALVGLDPDSVPRVLSSMLGQDYPFCRVVIPDRLGYSEIHLREHGFIFETGSERQEFDRPDAFLQAIEQSRATTDSASSWSDPVRLSLQAPAGRSGVVLLIPDSLQSLSDKPALLSVIASRAGFLVLAGKSDHQLDADSRLTLTSLLENLPGVQCVVTDEAPVPSDARGKIAWTAWPKSAYTLPPHFLASPDSPPFLPFLDSGSPQSGFKDYLGMQRGVSRLEEAMGLLDESLQVDLDQLANRMRLMDSGASATSAGAADMDARQTSEDIKNRLQDDLDLIKKNREDAAKRSLISGGELYVKLQRACDTITVEDIHQDRRDAVIKLSLSEDKLESLTEALRQEVRLVVTTDIATVEEGVDATKEEIESRLESILGIRTRLHLEPIDRTGWWDSIVSLARPEVRYRSEMAATTLAKRFSEARGGLSLIMLAGGLLTGLQAFVDQETLKSIKIGLYTLMIPMLLGGLAWTFYSVKKRSRATLSKELEKLREGVLAELRKVSGELLRVQGTQITTLLGRVAKQINTQAGDLLKKHETQAKGTREDEQRRARERNRGIEQRTREKTQQRTELTRLKAALGDIRRQLADWSRSLSGPSAAPIPATPGPLPRPLGTAPSPSRVLPSVPPSPSRILPPGQ